MYAGIGAAVIIDIPEYPADALREAVLNALVHMDYSVHTENMPIQITMYADRVEIRNPGGLYGRMTVDQLGNAQPDTRNPFIITAMEALGQTENRYSGIPRIRHAMAERSLPEPVFIDSRGEFTVCVYNQAGDTKTGTHELSAAVVQDERGLLAFCKTPRTRQEIADFLQITMVQYAVKRYVEPLVQTGALLLSVPDHPRSRRQTYRTNPRFNTPK